MVELSRIDKKLLTVIQIDYDTLKLVVDFLKTPTEAFDNFEKESIPTINLVAPTYYKVLNDCSIETSNSILVTLNSCFKEALNVKFFTMITDLHYAATLLTPHFRKFNFIPNESERAVALNSAQKYIRSMIDLGGDNEAVIAPEPKIQKKAIYKI